MRIKEKIEKSGYFWLPAMPDKKIPGVLKISDGGDVELEVVGLFDDSIDGYNRDVNGSGGLGRIVGHVEANDLVTLDDCFYKYRPLPLGGICKSVVIANRAYVGAAYDEEDIVQFNEFKFSVEGIDEWVDISGIRVDTDFESRSSTITYHPPKEIIINLVNEMRLLITFARTLPSSPVTTEAKITQKTFFKLVSDDVRSLDEFISTAYKITTLMCFAIDKTVCIDSVSANSKAIVRNIGDGVNIPAQLDIYYGSLPYDKVVPNVVWHRMLFRFSHIKDDVEKIINNWIKAYETIKPALNLYFSAKTGTHKYLDGKFLALAQGLETLHRRTSSETMMDQSEYSKLVSEIVSHCPDNQKKWLSNKLTYGNEISLARRLKHILEPFKKHVGLTKDRTQLIRTVVDTRNYLTHYDESNKKNVAHGRDLYPLCLKMEAIFQFHLLKVLGFTPTEIDVVYKNSSDLQEKLSFAYPKSSR